MRTRRESMALAVAGAAALALRHAPAAGAQDKNFLEAMVGFQQAVVFSYETVLRNAPLDAREQSVLERLRDQAEVAAAALRRALVEEGGTPPARRPLSEADLRPEDARRAGRDGLLRVVVGAEENVMHGWFLALQRFEDARLVSGSAAFMKAAAKRLVTLRDLAGDPLLPRPFETGTP